MSRLDRRHSKNRSLIARGRSHKMKFASTIPLLLLALSSAALAYSYVQPGSVASHSSPVETHHSLTRPFESHSVYWKYGGATVFTNKAIRLTPATQDRQGWLWNDFPLENADWEIGFSIKPGSRSSFGGDGFAFWLLHNEMDPSKGTALNGPLFGLRSDFHGIGVAFDSYDNDGSRDNPSVFVLKNFPGRDGEKAAMTMFNHNADFLNDMVKDSPVGIYRCTLDYRNSFEPIDILVRHQANILHVYADKRDSHGFQFCLSVHTNIPEFDRTGKLHMAFTALTGQLADVHDVTEITGRYLTAKDAQISDESLERVSDSSFFSWHSLYWFFVIMLTTLLIALSAWEFNMFMKLGKGQINAVTLCEKANAITVPHFSLYFFVNFLLIIGGQWLAVMLNMPVAGFRLWSLMQRNRVDIQSLQTEKFLAKYSTRVLGSLVFYAVMLIYFFIRW